jgi:hypothetical protein
MRFCNPLPRYAGITPDLARYAVSAHLRDGDKTQNATGVSPSNPTHQTAVFEVQSLSWGKQVFCKRTNMGLLSVVTFICLK